MIEPTVLRGFSDEYGSWKIICISRCRAFSASPCAARCPRPRTGSRPRWGRAGARAGVPSCSCRSRSRRRSRASRPASTSKDTSSTAFTAPIWRWKMIPRRDREVLDQVPHLHDAACRSYRRSRVTVLGRRGGRASGQLASAPGPAPTRWRSAIRARGRSAAPARSAIATVDGRADRRPGGRRRRAPARAADRSACASRGRRGSAGGSDSRTAG